MEDAVSVRRFLIALVAFAFVLAMGTIVFHHALGEGWIASLDRAVVTVTLTGLTSPPRGAWSQIFRDGNVMICVGTSSELSLLEELFAPKQAVAR